VIYRLESPLSLAMWIGRNILTWGDWREGYRYLDRINAVTVEDVKRVMEKYIDFNREIRVELKSREVAQ